MCSEKFDVVPGLPLDAFSGRVGITEVNAKSEPGRLRVEALKLIKVKIASADVGVRDI